MEERNERMGGEGIEGRRGWKKEGRNERMGEEELREEEDERR